MFNDWWFIDVRSEVLVNQRFDRSTSTGNVAVQDLTPHPRKNSRLHYSPLRKGGCGLKGQRKGLVRSLPECAFLGRGREEVQSLVKKFAVQFVRLFQRLVVRWGEL